ncbi:MAG: hypothetical protein ACREGH_02185 [Minisyncoccia bacterium]
MAEVKDLKKITLYRAYEQDGFVAYALEPLRGRPPADFQLFTLVDGKLYFKWPADIDNGMHDKNRELQDLAYLFGYTGKVPQRIVDKGSEPVLKYVDECIKRRRKKDTKAQTALQKKIEAIDLPVSVIHRGRVELTGRIVYYDDSHAHGGFEYRLESPIQDSTTIVMCYGLAMSGKQLITPDGKVSDWVVEDAQEFFVNAYKRKKREEKHSSRFTFEEE